MWSNPQETVDMVTFTEEILNGKLYFFVQCIIEEDYDEDLFERNLFNLFN